LPCAPPPPPGARGRDRPVTRTTDRDDLRSGGPDSAIDGPERAPGGPVPSDADNPRHGANGFGRGPLRGGGGDQVAVRLVAQPDAAGHDAPRAAADARRWGAFPPRPEPVRERGSRACTSSHRPTPGRGSCT